MKCVPQYSGAAQEKYAKDFAAGLTMGEIARKYGVTRQAVSNSLQTLDDPQSLEYVHRLRRLAKKIESDRRL